MALKHGKSWTNIEDKFLIDNIKFIGIDEMAKELKRTENAIKNRLQLKGISAITLKKATRERINRETDGIPLREFEEYKLNLGEKYHFESRTRKEKDSINEILTCVANYKNYIRCINKRGLAVCILKADLFTNEIKIKKVG